MNTLLSIEVNRGVLETICTDEDAVTLLMRLVCCTWRPSACWRISEQPAKAKLLLFVSLDSGTELSLLHYQRQPHLKRIRDHDCGIARCAHESICQNRAIADDDWTMG